MFRNIVPRVAIVLAVGACAAYSQKPAIFPNGVVNAASFYGRTPGNSDAVAIGSIASIFGINLANTTMSAQGFRYPRRSAGRR